MSESWASLYSPSADPPALARSLHAALAAEGYVAFDPFGLLPGPAYADAVRLFVGPVRAGWVRVLGVLDPALRAALARDCDFVYAALGPDGAVFDAGRAGGHCDRAAFLADHLRPGCVPADLARALSGEALAPVEAGGPDSPFDHLPDDVRALGAGVDPRQAQKLFDRLSGQLMRKAGADADAAGDLLKGGGPDWNSADGRRIRAVLGCITLPGDWRAPDLETLRDAYRLHNRRARKPDARLYPGDAETMARVPDSLAYIPVYAGKDA